MTDTALVRASGRDGDLALCVYLEPLIEGRRVLVLGTLGEATRSRLVRVVDELETLGREALEGELDLPFDTGAFDAVWLVDSSLLDPTPDALTELKRVLARDGALVVCSLLGTGPKRRRPGTPEAGLTRVLWPEFLELRMFRQSAVQGYALEEIEASAQGIAVDRSLLGSAETEVDSIVAIASDVQLQLDPSLWVQMPRADGPAHDNDATLRERLHEAVERGNTLARTLDAAEADLEDSFARVRSLEAQIAEHNSAEAHEREHRIRAERALEQAKREVEVERKRVAAAEAERDTVRAELEGGSSESVELEARLAERGAHIQALELDQKRSETVARDLLEELRRIEHERTTTVEHDSRIAGLEADIARAAARALEAEVAREAAEMRADELRARLGRLEAQPPAPAPVPDAALEGTVVGLRMRVRELEQSLREAPRAVVTRDVAADVARGEITGLTLRLAEAERALERHAGHEDRIRSLERELEEADRFAEAHADDGERIEALETELSRAHARFDDLEDDLRTTQDELQAARAEVEHLAVETSARVELAQRRENEARGERDHARAALEEARGILAQLTGKNSVDVTDPNIS